MIGRCFIFPFAGKYLPFVAEMQRIMPVPLPASPECQPAIMVLVKKKCVAGNIYLFRFQVEYKIVVERVNRQRPYFFQYRPMPEANVPELCFNATEYRAFCNVYYFCMLYRSFL